MIPATAQPEKTGNHHSIPYTQPGLQVVQSRAARTHACDLILKDFITTGPLQGIKLGIQILIQAGPPLRWRHGRYQTSCS